MRNNFLIPNFFILHFGENYMKIQPKIAKLQMFSFTFLCKFSQVIMKGKATCYSFTLLT